MLYARLVEWLVVPSGASAEANTVSLINRKGISADFPTGKALGACDRRLLISDDFYAQVAAARRYLASPPSDPAPVPAIAPDPDDIPFLAVTEPTTSPPLVALLCGSRHWTDAAAIDADVDALPDDSKFRGVIRHAAATGGHEHAAAGTRTRP